MSTASLALHRVTLSSKSTLKNHIISPTKELPTLKSLTSNVSNLALFGGDIFNVNHVERELECQICLSVLEDPILLGCNSHSVCSGCLGSLYNHQKKERGGGKLIYCPSCGKESGGLKVKNLNEIKVNKELIRVKSAYEKERALWVNEKIELETKLTDISNMAEIREAEKKKFEKLEKRGLDNNDAECLRDILQSFEMNQLKEVKEMILKAIETREKASAQPKKRGRPPKNSTEKDEDVEEDQNDVKTPKKRGRKPSASKSENTPPTRSKQTLINLQRNSPGTVLLKRTSTVNLEKNKKENFVTKTLKKLKTAQI